MPDAAPVVPPAVGGGLPGREAELRALRGLLAEEGPRLALLAGVPGIGKTALLKSFAVAARAAGAEVHVLDCRTVEPTEPAFLRALQAAGFAAGDGRPRLLCLDHYEHFGLLDAWLRAWFPGVRARGLRLLLAGRGLPDLGWAMSGEPPLALQLGALDDDAVAALLESAGVEGSRARRVREVARGHPLALMLAIGAARAVPQGSFEALALPELMRRLTGYFLDDCVDADLRAALEAASAVRRVTRPLLAALLDRAVADDLYERLAQSPLVESRRDGLALHPTVHGPLARWTHAADPERFTRYRRRAWQELERAGRGIGAGDLWRHTADVIYLIEDPIVREAFFPSREQALRVEPARPDDHAGVIAIAATHDGSAEAARIARLIERHPRAFYVARDRAGALQGWSCLLDAGALDAEDLAADPLMAAWHADLPPALRAGRGHALFLRRWLCRVHGDAPSPVQAACWLDVKRAYLEMRPRLRRVYLAVADLAPYAQAAAKLGFAPACADAADPLRTARLDFGAGSVDGWLGRLLRAELGVPERLRVDVDAHLLEIEGRQIPLTAREADVLGVLVGAEGAVVGRDRLLDEAWDGGRSVGSNVVDVLIRGLRAKLGAHAARIETVRGVGYRWAP